MEIKKLTNQLKIQNVTLNFKSLSNISDKFTDFSHYYCNYDVNETINNLFNLQVRRNFANIVILFSEKDLDVLLRHINVYDFFSYTLIPDFVSPDIYSKIYDFFFFSPLSVSYITWVGSLIFQPKLISNKVEVNGELVDLGECGECILAKRNCSKIVPFLNLYHPEKEPTDSEINIMCDILRKFSLKIFQDFENNFINENFLSFSYARQSVGIKSHYLLDVWGIY